jgi:hypothetical protein
MLRSPAPVPGLARKAPRSIALERYEQPGRLTAQLPAAADADAEAGEVFDIGDG